MRRIINQELTAWVKNPARKPLLIRGARQVGKTYAATALGQQRFRSLVTINFEKEPGYADCFKELDPQKIISQITQLSNQSIIAGQTLLLLDEIQECPNAIRALRYFKEEMPQLHIIATGSLLEFTLNSAQFSMPVGRVQSLYMYPVSFYEFLAALGHDKLCDYLTTINVKDTIPDSVHNKLLSLIREYFVLGGMPEVIANYSEHKDLHQVQILHADILNTYRNDFGKYAPHTQHKYLQKLFDKAPGMVGQHFRYVKIDPNMESRDIRSALDYLSDAKIIHRIHHTSASGLPLKSQINEKKFKLLFVDLGLIYASMLIDPKMIFHEDLLLLNQGALAEQFVGEELMAYAQPYLPAELFFWAREKKSSQAEVDYVVNFDQWIVPIEVKAGKTGRLKSLNLFMQEKKSELGIQISQHQLKFHNNILTMPLYLIHEIKRLALQILSA